MILGILQARASSRRLPGKVLKPILGRPMVALQIERIRDARRLDHLVIATSDQSSDDPVAEVCREAGVEVFRGSLDDVLDRFYQAALRHRPEHVVRMTGDCPLADPAIIDQAIDLHVKGGYDYSSNALQRSYPDGLDVEVFRYGLLEKAWRLADTPYEREHVCPYMYGKSAGSRLGHLLWDRGDYSSYRWTVDTAADFDFVKRVYEILYPQNPKFRTMDIMELLVREPELMKINARTAGT